MVRIYVVTHKRIDLERLSLPECYQIIRVGSHDNMTSIELRDDDGQDNIADKNRYYCELTAMYWIWKNDKSSKYVGLCHYRRFFTSSAFGNKPDSIIGSEKIESILKDYDVIAPYKAFFWKGTVNAFLKCGYERDLKITGDAIQALYPEYYQFWESEVLHSASNYLYNMFIMQSDLLSEYSMWLFNILDYVEQRVDMTDYNKAQQRLYGYLSERLLGVWMSKNNLRIYHMRVLNVESRRGIPQVLKQIVKRSGISDFLKQCVYNTFYLKNRNKDV